jgi:hypothetical protein
MWCCGALCGVQQHVGVGRMHPPMPPLPEMGPAWRMHRLRAPLEGIHFPAYPERWPRSLPPLDDPRRIPVPPLP